MKNNLFWSGHTHNFTFEKISQILFLAFFPSGDNLIVETQAIIKTIFTKKKDWTMRTKIREKVKSSPPPFALKRGGTL